jgi:hypothetical protein
MNLPRDESISGVRVVHIVGGLFGVVIGVWVFGWLAEKLLVSIMEFAVHLKSIPQKVEIIQKDQGAAD